MYRLPSAIAIALCLATPSAAQMSTAEQVRPILTMTAASWIAVRKWQGQDLLYFTQILPFRCGLSEIRYGLNGADATERFNAEPCPPDQDGQVFATIEADEYLPYLTFEEGSIETVTITLVYDDGIEETLIYDRSTVEMQ